MGVTIVVLFFALIVCIIGGYIDDKIDKHKYENIVIQNASCKQLTSIYLDVDGEYSYYAEEMAKKHMEVKCYKDHSWNRSK